MTKNRTIVDILRKGNQELFHSSMLAWFLDPQGEHSYGSRFLERFADLLAAHGSNEMQVALQGASVSSVNTETTTYKGRYDIVLTIGQFRVIIENKTKSLGALAQFDQYKGQGVSLVALGLTDISFSRDVRKGYPVITYRNICTLLESLGDPAANDFGVLARHYRDFLHRELSVLDDLDTWATSGSEEVALRIKTTVDGTVGVTQNDRRFLNLYHLERFRDYVLLQPQWRGCRWETDKNMRSGVWLALFDPGSPPSPFRFNDVVRKFRDDNSVELWFHLELWDGVLATTDVDTAGTIQIKCHAKNKNNVAAMQSFRAIYALKSDERLASRVKGTADTFYLVGRSLLRKHLPHASLEGQLESFMGRFGSFIL